MSDKDFKVKKLLCDVGDINSKSSEMERQWLEALLRRIGIPGLMLKKRVNNTMSNIQWRHYLFTTFNLDILNDKPEKKVTLIKYVDGDKDGSTQIIAEWSEPEVVRINKKGQRPYCELRLKYWQLI